MRLPPPLRFAYRIAVGVVGVVVVIVGIIVVPLPGPGWAVIFVGLGILATEFDWARRVLVYARERYRVVMEWMKRQGLWVQAAGAAFTVVFTVASLWLVGAVGFVFGLFGVEHEILKSPLA